jgi:hypothetical protein
MLLATQPSPLNEGKASYRHWCQIVSDRIDHLLLPIVVPSCNSAHRAKTNRSHGQSGGGSHARTCLATTGVQDQRLESVDLYRSPCSETSNLPLRSQRWQQCCCGEASTARWLQSFSTISLGVYGDIFLILMRWTPDSSERIPPWQRQVVVSNGMPSWNTAYGAIPSTAPKMQMTEAITEASEFLCLRRLVYL